MALYRLFRRPLVALWVVVIFLLTSTYYLFRDKTLRNSLSYATRPLWDSDASSFPSDLIPQYHATGLPSNDSQACARQGWQVRSPPPSKVIDAIIFSTEIELLEIRLEELWDAVDTFVIVESKRTFMGKPKNLTFYDNKNAFRKYESKIVYHQLEGRDLKKGENPFAVEGEQRRAVTDLLSNRVRPAEGSLLLMSDADEIPSLSTISLLTHCQAPLPMHLQLHNYLYSFEFPTASLSWRAQAHLWPASYNHGRSSSRLLLDSGWHCSSCFRRIADFAFKMQSYSHSDRLYGNRHWRQLLDPRVIASKVCQGKDLFNMLPQAYTWAELLQRWKGEAKSSSVANLPTPVVKDPTRFAFLLPGGCKLRE